MKDKIIEELNNNWISATFEYDDPLRYEIDKVPKKNFKTIYYGKDDVQYGSISPQEIELLEAKYINEQQNKRILELEIALTTEEMITTRLEIELKSRTEHFYKLVKQVKEYITKSK